VLLANDRNGKRFEIRPIVDPPFYSDFVLIEPARKEMSGTARLFADILGEETRRIGEQWDEAIGAGLG
jgi:DNA-binding transcriptional LysR family regulator